jgi:hypothetical protein
VSVTLALPAVAAGDRGAVGLFTERRRELVDGIAESALATSATPLALTPRVTKAAAARIARRTRASRCMAVLPGHRCPDEPDRAEHDGCRPDGNE